MCVFCPSLSLSLSLSRVWSFPRFGWPLIVGHSSKNSSTRLSFVFPLGAGREWEKASPILSLGVITGSGACFFFCNSFSFFFFCNAMYLVTLPYLLFATNLATTFFCFCNLSNTTAVFVTNPLVNTSQGMITLMQCHNVKWQLNSQDMLLMAVPSQPILIPRAY